MAGEPEVLNSAMSIPERLEPVLRLYPFAVESITVENLKEKKSVWWLDTDIGRLVMKLSPNPPRQMRFVLAVARHLQERGVRIPEMLPTRAGEFCAELDGACYVVSRAAGGRTPSYFVKRELEAIIRGLAGFHRASRGFAAPDGAYVRSHLGTWRHEYAGRLADLERFAAQASPGGSEFSSIVSRESVVMVDQARRALSGLDGPAYERCVKRVASGCNICHQDFAAGNLALAGNDLYIFDLDSVTVDHEARDLRKIVNKVMKKSGGWDASLLREMLVSYHAVNPLGRDDYEALKTDLAFPHLFHGVVSKYYERRESEWSPSKFLKRLKDIVRLEKAKGSVLARFDEIVDSLGCTHRGG